MKTAISPTRAENYPQWYQEVVTAADLAQLSPVRGCMIMTPWGYAIWEMIQQSLDYQIKAHGHENIYCPLFVPLSDLEKEAEHVDGFAKECAVVTHTRLQKNDQGQLIPASPLEEPLIVRPTSEMIIGELFASRVQSHRDLPILMNQWANIVRWEMRTRMFLRTTEFLWQEGHTAHQSAEEAHAHTLTMLNCYRDLCHHFLAIPIVTGKKSINEKFPGATDTYTIEGIMQDGKALQMGTSHFLGQTFAKSCHIQYQDEQGQLQYVYTTSWGVTTRLIGGLIMTHADDDGLICPPTLAPYQIVIIPVTKKNADTAALLDYCQLIKLQLSQVQFKGQALRVHIDLKDRKHSEKKWTHVKKGVPIRLEIGQRECDSQSVCYASRIQTTSEKHELALSTFLHEIESLLDTIQTTLFTRAKARLDAAHCPLITDQTAFNTHFSQPNPGPALIYWADDDAVEDALQAQFKVSIRCYPLADNFHHAETGPALFTAQTTGTLAMVAKAY